MGKGNAGTGIGMKERHYALDWKVYLMFLVCAVFYILFSSTDSFLYAPWSRFDSAWFFMCGKAMMNGMLPYVDFSDSKGPLLWLIYGIAYLIDHTSYVGVCVPATISYWAVMVLAYKLSRLYIGRRPSAVVGLVMPVLYFNIIHLEIRAEDFCYPFVMCLLYVATCYLHGKGEKRHSVCAGISIGALLLIKYSVAFMGGVVLAVAFAVVAVGKKWDKVKEILVWTAVGCGGIMLPFAVYLGALGCLDDMWREYVVNTMMTVEADEHQGAWKVYFDTIYALWEHNRYYIKVAMVLIFGTLPICFKDRRLYFAPFISAVAVSGAAVMHFHNYYLCPLITWAVFLMIFVFDTVKISDKMPKWIVAIVALWAIYYAPTNTLYFMKGFMTEKVYKNSDNSWAKISRCIAEESDKEHPTMVYTGGEVGYGLWADALPGCKYWSSQEDATREMKAEKAKEVKEKKPDFIIEQGYGVVSFVPDMAEMGYEVCYTDDNTKVYKRR